MGLVDVLDAEPRGDSLARWDLTVLLERSILAPDFSLGPDWVEGIDLNQAGERLVQEVLRADPALSRPAATFACFLTGQLDLVEMPFDEECLLLAINSCMESGTLFFPNVIGRVLHDEVGRQFPSRLDSLDNVESLSVLRELPQGVMQSGHFTVGPLGARRVAPVRRLLVGPFVPGFLCSDADCFDLHPLRLATNRSADINRALRVFHQAVNVIGPLEQGSLTAALRSGTRRASGKSQALVDLLSDGFSVEELLGIALDAYENASPEARLELREFLGANHQSTALSLKDASREALIQFLLYFPDRSISESIERCVESGSLALTPTDLRQARVDGRWGRRATHEAQLSKIGLRIRNKSESPAMSLMKMTHYLYFSGEMSTPEDLAFLLDKPATAGVDDLLNSALRLGDMKSVVNHVLLHDRECAHAVLSCLDLSGTDRWSRIESVDRVAWQLGESSRLQFDGLERLNGFAESLADAVATQRGEEVILGHVANLFKELERALQRALTFTTWALSTDHEYTTEGYFYDTDMSSDVFDFIETNSETQDSYRLNPGRKNSFASLAAGFSRLASALNSLNLPPDQPDGHTHDIRERPKVFLRGPAFLSLTENSRLLISTHLTRMSELLGTEIVARVRNATIHGDNLFPTAANFHESLDRIREWIELVRSTGVYPSVSTLVLEQRDGMGREESRYISPSGEQQLFTPQWHDTGRMPTGGPQLLFLPAASLGTVGPLRFQLGNSANDDVWRGYPRRAESDDDA